MEIQLTLQSVSKSLEEHLQPAVQIMPYGEHLLTILRSLGKKKLMIQNNFYVDDLLKSVKDLDIAKTLVKNAINMCRSGGFNLKKFISSSKELLISIPEDKRRPGFKDLNLLGGIPVEKALGIQWNILKDYFSFNIRFSRRNLTKRVMLSTISSIYDPLRFTSPFVLEGRQLLQHLCNQNVKWSETVDEELKS